MATVTAPGPAADQDTSVPALASAALVVVAVAALTGALAVAQGQVVGDAIAGLLGAGAGAVLARRAPIAPVAALLGVGALLGSPFVQEGGANAATLCAVAACVVAALRCGREILLPARPVAIALAAYVGVLVVATAGSIERSTSVTYVAGTVAVLLVAFVAVPTLVQDAWSRVLGSVSVMAVLVAAGSVVLWTTGARKVASEHLGVYYMLQLTAGSDTTSLTLPRASGIYLRPAGAGMTLALGCVCALSLLPEARRRARLAVGAAAVVTTVGALLTFARSAQLGIVMGGALLLLLRRWRREPLAVAAVAVVLAVGLAMAADQLGAVDRLDLTIDRYGREATEAIVNDPAAIDVGVGTKVRGGTDLSSRRALWEASVGAIGERPIIGSGPGTVATAIAPHLPAGYEGYAGLSSHSTPLRVGVESGAAGLLALVAVHVAAAGVALRRRPRWGWPLAAVAVTAVGLGLSETLSFGGFLLASLVWTMAVGGLAATPSGLRVPGLLRLRRPGATAGRGSETAAPPAPTPSRG